MKKAQFLSSILKIINYHFKFDQTLPLQANLVPACNL